MMAERPQIYHCLNSRQFSRPFVEEACHLADMARIIGKTKAGMEFLSTVFNDKRAMLFFTQPSTRTFLSFFSACQILGMHCAEVRDSRTSSEVKGESEEDTLRTFSSFFDLIIMRHYEAGLAETIAALLDQTERPVPVINAGSGKDQHPTQALLDIYTLKRCFQDQGGIDGKSIAFVGDLLRGRTIRSLSLLLSKYNDVKMVFVAPPPFQAGRDILGSLEEEGVSYQLEENFESVIPRVDAIYMTRLQDEWDKEEHKISTIDMNRYSFQAHHLELLQPHAVLLHPLPRRQEIAPEVDGDPRAVYWRQVRNGMWIRVALLALIFQRQERIIEYFEHAGGHER